MPYNKEGRPHDEGGLIFYFVFRWLLFDDSADALIREQFEQDAVFHAAVHDSHLVYAAVQGVQAAVDLGDHAAGERAVLLHAAWIR